MLASARRGLLVHMHVACFEAAEEGIDPGGHSGTLPEISLVASLNQLARNAGMARPSQSTNANCTITGSILARTGSWPSGASP